MPYKLICRRCGCDDVRRDAWAAWDVKMQQETLAEVYSSAFCIKCDHATSLSQVELTPEEILQQIGSPPTEPILDDLPTNETEILRAGLLRIVEACRLNDGSNTADTGLSWEMAHLKIGSFANAILQATAYDNSKKAETPNEQ